ncbi:polysaccharide deacetylase family protein [Phreatobacter cathodiphilus]|uniref:polysaccharide deacetylase family protein n=1 Tax=Phreatobacter cathodiphilus TaxID=1868589 RepID=UPI0015E72040|nr:polysaccharide deacetylase family protein [Phreatobacter cathodiphilus]
MNEKMNGLAHPTLFRPVRGRAPADPLVDPDEVDFGGLFPRLDHMIGRRIAFRTAAIHLDRPVVSITFDDFPRTADTPGARILEDHGARGTFYPASGLFGLTNSRWTVAGAETVADLHRRGHEIGLHGHAHRPANLLDPAAFAADLAANRAALRRIVPGLVRENYAYPYGQCGVRQKKRLSASVRSSRSVQPGINAGRTDLDFLKSVEISARGLTENNLDRWLDRAEAASGWLVLFTHDVSEAPSLYGTTPRVLARIVSRALERGFAVLPVAAALDRAGIA